MKEYHIYMICNTVNSKLYIGSTTKSLNKRWRLHISDSKRQRTKNFPLYIAFKKHGVDNFCIEHVETIDVNTKDEARIVENEYIDAYDSINNGYNAYRAYQTYDEKVMQHLECSKIWRSNNREHIKIWRRNYRKNNKQTNKIEK